MSTTAGHFGSKVQEYAGTLTYFVGDTLPNLTLNIAYDGGAGAVDLTNATINVSIARLTGKMAIKSGTATLKSAVNGEALFSWGNFTFNSPGTYVGQVRIDFAGTAPLSTQKFLIEVLNRVAGL